MNKHGWDNLAVKLIGTLCTGNHCATWQALMVPQQVFHQERFTGIALTNENNYTVVLDAGHVELT
jgi:hypothetical protein